MSTARVYVLPQVIADNLARGANSAPIQLDLGYAQEHGFGAEILDSAGKVVARVVYKRQGGGMAQAWIEVDASRVRLT